ncbi:ribonuclease E domain-containing protein [Marimonas lutisalis]|uniref:energy transducer TonB n=1 Tax=Marimonas lutisalis TaxID=2545756 RepID=UPI0010FA19ED|nr:energy transducer TonB [Marimonas lutisalis]
MNAGQVISGMGHIGLIGWLLFGGQFQSEPLPFEVTDVAVISGEEFEAMMAAQRAPETVTDVAMPQAPEPDTPPAPQIEAAPESAPDQVEPEVAEIPPQDDTPAPVEPAPPTPTEVEDRPPEIAPPTEEDVAALVPQTSPRPQARPVERVAPTPVAQPPEPEAAPDNVVREETSDAPAEEARPEEEATAPEETVTEITPEAADEVTAAPTRSVRPKTRPQRTQPPTETAESGSSTSDAVNAALQAAQQGGGETEAQSTAPQLSQGERDALIVAVSDCWAVDPGAPAAQVTVVVSVELNRDGTLAGTPKLVGAEGGDGAAQAVAFRNARTAVIACGRGGFNLPEDKYEAWREIEMTFNPEKMRLR